MKKLLALLILSPIAGFAQSSPNWNQGYVPTPAEWNSWWTRKANVNQGSLNIPSIFGGTMDGTVVGGSFPAAGSFTTINITASQGLQFGGANGIFVTPGVAWQQGIFNGPRAGAYVQSNNLNINFGMVATGVAALENLSNGGAEAACGGAFACQYATTAYGITGWGEHVIGFDNSSYITMGGNDSGRDVIGCTNCVGWGPENQRDGIGNNNTSLGAFALHGNAGSILITGNPTIGDVYHIAFSTTNPNVVGLPSTVSFTATTTNPTDLSTGLINAINGLVSTVTYLRPDGRTTWTDSGVGLGAFPAPLPGAPVVIGLHFPGSQSTGWNITPVTSCTGTCTATLAVSDAYSGTDNIAIGSQSLYGIGLTTGSYNLSVGDGCLANAAGTSSASVCLGYNGGFAATSVNSSVLVGLNVAHVASVLSGEVIIGYGAAAGLTTGPSNTVVGAANGNANCITSGTGNLELGQGACVPSPTASWQGSIMSSIFITNANIGGGGSSYGQVGFGGQKAPSAVIDILGSDTSSGTLAFRAQNSTPANLLSVADDGTIKVGTSTGLSCTGTPTSSFATVNGIVTHC